MNACYSPEASITDSSRRQEKSARLDISVTFYGNLYQDVLHVVTSYQDPLKAPKFVQANRWTW